MGKGLGAVGIILACLLVAGCAAPTTQRSEDAPDLTGDLAPSAFDGTSAPAPALMASLTPPAADPVARSMSLPDRLADLRRWDATPVVANDASALVDQLVTAERAVRDPLITGDQLAYMGHVQQLVYRRLIERPALRDAVFAAIPSDVRAAADLNFAASADLWVFGQVRVTRLPAWRIVQPPPIDELLGYYHEAEKQFDVPWYYLAAINLVETRMGRIRGDSYAGARGPMQFMPATWDAYGKGDINDPHDAILAAGRYLRAAGAPKNMDRAIWAYNHDNDYVDAVKKYAEVMRADPNAYRGFYGWQVYYQTASGIVHLPIGYPKP